MCNQRHTIMILNSSNSSCNDNTNNNTANKHRITIVIIQCDAVQPYSILYTSSRRSCGMMMRQNMTLPDNCSNTVADAHAW